MAKRDLGDVAAKALTRPGVGPALLAGLGVYLALALQVVLSALVFVVVDGQDPVSYLAASLGVLAPIAFGGPLPFALGVFLCFWQLAPVAPQLRMAHVVTRALLAAVVGTFLALVIGFVSTAALVFSRVSSYASLGADPTLIPLGLKTAWIGSAPGAFNMLIDGLVVVPLAALLLWGWLRGHRPEAAPAGALDEV